MCIRDSCYTGGFSVYALTGGAQKVDSVDISGKAMDLTDVNISLNNFGNHHRSFTENVIPYLNQVETDSYDIVAVSYTHLDVYKRQMWR